METVIKTEGLTKIYRGFGGKKEVEALKDLSLEIRAGEIYGLLGPNGSGKTTALKLLLGLLKPTSGSISILGKPAHDVEVKRHIGFLPEESYLYTFLNAEETLHFYGRLLGMARKQRVEKIGPILKLVGLADVRKRLIRDYSKGMARRIGLAQILMKDPKIIILDEPTIGLDPIGSKEIKDIIMNLKHEGRTILLSSHLLSEVQAVCERIGILNRGILFMEGRIDTVLARQSETEFVVRGLDPEAEAAILKTIETHKGELIFKGHPKESLESLFIKTVEDKERAPD